MKSYGKTQCDPSNGGSCFVGDGSEYDYENPTIRITKNSNDIAEFAYDGLGYKNFAKAKLHSGSIMMRVLTQGQESKTGLMFLFVLVLIVFITGCKRGKDVDVSGISPVITKKGKLTWHCNFGGYTSVKVNAYLSSHASLGLEKNFKERKAFIDRDLSRCRKMADLAPTEELRKSYREQIELYEKDLFSFAGSWENWPIVMVTPLLLKDVKPTKAYVLCRYQPKHLDVVFTMYCPHEITHRDLLRIAKELTSEFEALDQLKWKKIPIKDEPMFDDEGFITLEDIAKFAKDAVFIGPPN